MFRQNTKYCGFLSVLLKRPTKYSTIGFGSINSVLYSHCPSSNYTEAECNNVTDTASLSTRDTYSTFPLVLVSNPIGFNQISAIQKK